MHHSFLGWIDFDKERSGGTQQRYDLVSESHTQCNPGGILLFVLDSTSNWNHNVFSYQSTHAGTCIYIHYGYIPKNSNIFVELSLEYLFFKQPSHLFCHSVVIQDSTKTNNRKALIKNRYKYNYEVIIARQ